MKSTKILIAIGVFLLVCLAWFLYKPAPKEEVKRAIALPTVANALLKEDKNGRRVWELSIEKMTLDVANQKNKLEGVRGKLFREDGSVVELTSKGGEYDLRSKNIALNGDVVVTTSVGEKLTADSLTLENAQNIIVATGKAVFTKDKTTARADKITTDTKLELVKLLGNAYVSKH